MGFSNLVGSLLKWIFGLALVGGFLADATMNLARETYKAQQGMISYSAYTKALTAPETGQHTKAINR